MSCPLFEDYTRGCIESFPDFVTFSNLGVCESNEYKKCPLYIVVKSRFKCQYIHTCSHLYLKGVPDFIEKIFLDEKFKGDILISLMKRHCLSEDNYKDCMRYKRISQGEEPPLTLFSDGKEIDFVNFVYNKKIVSSPEVFE
jgi:hypothetical protein